jgi:hypothetical protein
VRGSEMARKNVRSQASGAAYLPQPPSGIPHGARDRVIRLPALGLSVADARTGQPPRRCKLPASMPRSAPGVGQCSHRLDGSTCCQHR